MKSVIGKKYSRLLLLIALYSFSCWWPDSNVLYLKLKMKFEKYMQFWDNYKKNSVLEKNWDADDFQDDWGGKRMKMK